MTEGARRRLVAALGDDCRVRFDVPLAELTTWRIGGPAEVVVEPEQVETIIRLRRLAAAEGWPLRVLGNGSNVLAPDGAVSGIVLRLAGALNRVDYEGDLVRAEAGAFLPKLARDAAARGLTGLECVVGVPGTVGGGVVMNAGVPEGTLGQVVRWAEVLRPDGRIDRLTAADLAFAHRDSRLQHEPGLVLRAELRLGEGDPAAITETMDRHMAHRRATQPLNLPSAGSVFRRPPGAHPGALLEEAGCKGLRRGGAEVSELHANWIVNRGGATAAEVRWLIIEMRRRVREQSGVELHLEVEIWHERQPPRQDLAGPA